MMSYDDDPFLRNALQDTRILAPKHKEGLPCECKNEAGSVRISFCRKACCPNLDEAKTECTRHRKPKGTLDLRHRPTTLRQNWKAGGWHYRNIP